MGQSLMSDAILKDFSFIVEFSVPTLFVWLALAQRADPKAPGVFLSSR